MEKTKLNRRQFLKAVGVTGAFALPVLLGYGVMQSDQGEGPEVASPYVRQPSIDGPLSPALILLLTNTQADNPFGLYLAEILRAEGLKLFQIVDLAEFPEIDLGQYGLVLLSESQLSVKQTAWLEQYVFQGGRLVAMRPDRRLTSLLGVQAINGQTSEGYIHGIGDGDALQFHGLADHYRLAGATALAYLSVDGETASTNPAVTLHSYGQGQAAAWTLDLARSVALTRQGNPDWSNQERDGPEGIRAHDAFVGWLDLDRIAVPQADIQMRFLTRLISNMLADVTPLPRLWYFPGAAERMLIVTGDSHQNVAFAVEDVLSRVEARQGRMSVYYTPPPVSSAKRMLRKARWWAADQPFLAAAAANPNTLPSPALIAGWRDRGHEFTFHPEVEEGVEAGLLRYWQEFTAMGYGPLSPTVRTHRVLWTGWTETARIQSSLGLRMNLDFYHIGPSFRNQAGEWVFGHFTGSGLPMKFVDEQGRILNIYQQLTQLVDENLLATLGGWAELSAEQAIVVSRQLLSGPPAAVCAQFHIDPFHAGGEGAIEAGKWLEWTLDYATSQNIPIWSAQAWLDFSRVRDDTRLEEIVWQPNEKRLQFQLVAPAIPEMELAVMLPLQNGQADLAGVEVDGRATAVQQRTLDGIAYGWFTVEAGSRKITAIYS